MELHPKERDVLDALARAGGSARPSDLAGVDPTTAQRMGYWLSQKGLVALEERTVEEASLTEEGRLAARDGLIERRLLNIISRYTNLDDLFHMQGLSREEVSIGIGWLKKNNWIEIGWCPIGKAPQIRMGEKLPNDKAKGKKVVSRTKTGEDFINNNIILLHEKILKKLDELGTVRLEVLKSFFVIKPNKDEFRISKESADEDEQKFRLSIDILIHRNLISISERAEVTLSITDAGRRALEEGSGDEVTQLTTQMLASGSWRQARFRRYDVTLPVPPARPGRRHPLCALVDRVRRIFLDMGFAEAQGPFVESSFWCFDALFQPQDHPARELADTFYMASPSSSPLPERLVEGVRRAHEHGTPGSTGWGYRWSEEVSRRPVLRTHTTAVSARSLAGLTPPAKVFCVDRAFRNEALDYKHLSELHQVEGIVAAEGVTFRDLLGYLREFYTRLGFERVRFRPAYFPYTEMSVEPEVWMASRRTWVELGGAGMLRPEVTEPLGVTCPVLAWGLGLERTAMMALAVQDIRTFYRNDMDWLREARGVV